MCDKENSNDESNIRSRATSLPSTKDQVELKTKFNELKKNENLLSFDIPKPKSIKNILLDNNVDDIKNKGRRNTTH
jgi:uncharacterized alpha/beta hydrolase family protein